MPVSSDDAALVLAARGGDGEAFTTLFRRWSDRCFDVARRILRDDGAAAEVAQDTFLVAWRQLDALQDPGAFGGWVLRTARNRALNRLEKARRSTPLAGDAPAFTTVPSAHDVEGDVTAAGHAEMVWAAAATLGERDASVLDLHLRHGLDPAEIADELGIEPNAAHQLLFRLRKRLAAGIRAWVLFRGGDPECPDLRSALDGAGVTAFGRDAARVVEQHIGGCVDCDTRQAAVLAPEALFAIAPVLVMAPQVREAVVASLRDGGVPLSPQALTPTPADVPAQGSGPDVSAGGGDSPGDGGRAEPEDGSEDGPEDGPSGGGVAGADTVALPVAGAGRSGGPPADTGGAAGPPGDDHGRHRRRLAAVVLVAALLLLSGGAVWLLAGGGPDDEPVLAGGPDSSEPRGGTSTTANNRPSPTSGSTTTRPAPATTAVPTTTTPTTPTTATTATTAASAPPAPTVPTTAGDPSTATSPVTQPTTPPTAPQTTTTRPPAPRVDSFGATAAGAPGGACPAGQWATTLAWTTTHATSVRIAATAEPTASGLAPDGNRVACRLTPGAPPGGWKLTATGPGGSATATA